MKLFKNALIYSQGLLKKGFLVVDQGKIKKIGLNEPSEDKSAKFEEILDCHENLLLPGFIDTHVHFRDLDHEYKETLETGSMCALSGGVTTVLAMPNTKPFLATPEVVDKYFNTPRKLYCNIGINAGISGGFSFEGFEKIVKNGIFGLKIYQGQQSKNCPLEWDPFWQELEINSKEPKEIIAQLSQVGSERKINFENWEKLLFFTQKMQIPILFHPELPYNSEFLKENYEKALNRAKTEGKYPHPELIAHHIAHPIEKNEFALILMISYFLLKLFPDPKTSPSVHFCHVTNIQCANFIAEMKAKGYPITVEVTPHHCFLNYSQQFSHPGAAKVLTPLRSPETQQELWYLVQNNGVDTIATDHAPHTFEEKTKDFSSAPAGFPGVDFAVPFLLTQSCKYQISLESIIHYFAEMPAQIFHIPNKGFLLPKYDADFILVEKCSSYKFDASQSLSKAKWSPYDGKELSVKINTVYLNGQLAFDRTKKIFNPYGKWIRKI